MYSIGLYPLVDIPNRISNHSVSLIDNICTNVTNHKVANGIAVSDSIDHLHICCCSYPNPNRVEHKCVSIGQQIVNC